MMSNQEEHEFIAVRVQDPRIQNEGSWNSYVDYKIFLHTNSKAFTAKTSCVRRRYSEFAWLKKKLQKNAGLVPVPDLPGKSFFSFSNEDFLEGRRKGLQAFLDKVVHMTVCLSDSQLHLFLQTQLPVGHIQDCVQGHTPYSVTDAILTYASSNRGFAQAQEDDSIKEHSLTISYESMESPIPHQPCVPAKDTFSPELVPCDSDPLEGLLQLCDEDRVELQPKEESSIRILQKNNHLEAIAKDGGATEVSFFLGDGRDDPENLSLAEQTRQRSCQIQTPVEVHSTPGTGFEVNCGENGESEEQPDRRQSSEEAVLQNNSETEKCMNSAAISDFKDSDAGTQEGVQEDVCSEKWASENDICEVNILRDVADVSHLEEVKSADEQNEPNEEESAKSESTEAQLEPELQDDSVPPVENGDDDGQTDKSQAEQEADLVGNKDESNNDGRSLTSSNESIVQVSDEESVCDEDLMGDENGYMETSREEVDDSSRNILDIHMNGRPEEKDQEGVTQAKELQYVAHISELRDSLDIDSNVSEGDLVENSDFSILETSRAAGLADGKYTE